MSPKLTTGTIRYKYHTYWFLSPRAIKWTFKTESKRKRSNKILLSFLDLERTIHEANLTFIDSVNKWDQIYEQFPAIQDAAAKFQNVTEKGESHRTFVS